MVLCDQSLRRTVAGHVAGGTLSSGDFRCHTRCFRSSLSSLDEIGACPRVASHDPDADDYLFHFDHARRLAAAAEARNTSVLFLGNTTARLSCDRVGAFGCRPDFTSAFNDGSASFVTDSAPFDGWIFLRSRALSRVANPRIATGTGGSPVLRTGFGFGAIHLYAVLRVRDATIAARPSPAPKHCRVEPSPVVDTHLFRV